MILISVEDVIYAGFMSEPMEVDDMVPWRGTADAWRMMQAEVEPPPYYVRKGSDEELHFYHNYPEMAAWQEEWEEHNTPYDYMLITQDYGNPFECMLHLAGFDIEKSYFFDDNSYSEWGYICIRGRLNGELRWFIEYYDLDACYESNVYDAIAELPVTCSEEEAFENLATYGKGLLNKLKTLDEVRAYIGSLSFSDGYDNTPATKLRQHMFDWCFKNDRPMAKHFLAARRVALAPAFIDESVNQTRISTDVV